MTFPIPAGTTLAVNGYGCVDVTDVQVSCDIGALPAGGSRYVKIALAVNAPPGSTVTTRQKPGAFGLHVTGEVSDPNLSNNSTDAPVSVS